MTELNKCLNDVDDYYVQVYVLTVKRFSTNIAAKYVQPVTTHTHLLYQLMGLS
jgi:hypothetical protein